MLKEIRNMRELSFGKLMEIYAQSNFERGKKWVDENEERQIYLAEQEMYAYLRQCFFALPDSRYFLWEDSGKLVSAVRCESYGDGILLTALETIPIGRNRGYATDLLKAVLQRFSDRKIYAHIRYDNLASMAVHLRCGFVKVKSGARMLDGSYNREHDTYLWKNNN